MITIQEHIIIGRFLRYLRHKLIKDEDYTLHGKKYKTKVEFHKSREKKIIKLIEKMQDNLEEVMFSDNIDTINYSATLSMKNGLRSDYLNIYYGDLTEEDRMILTKLEMLKNLEDIKNGQ